MHASTSAAPVCTMVRTNFGKGHSLLHHSEQPVASQKALGITGKQADELWIKLNTHTLANLISAFTRVLGSGNDVPSRHELKGRE